MSLWLHHNLAIMATRLQRYGEAENKMLEELLRESGRPPLRDQSSTTT